MVSVARKPSLAAPISPFQFDWFQNFSRIAIRQLLCCEWVYVDAAKPKYTAERMHSLVRKFRNLLEASWALSPTMVGMACLTLDLAALLHWRLKATHSALAYRQVRSRE
jgi:hypothetical protein